MANSITSKVLGITLKVSARMVFNNVVPLSVQRKFAEAPKYAATLPKGVTRSAWSVNGREGDLFMPPKLASDKHAILYLHGGGYVICSPGSHRALTSRFCEAASLPVYVPDYRLAPESPYPAQLEDAWAALMKMESLGYKIENILVAGDSAGGNLTLALTQMIRQNRKPMPAALGLISPWTDASFSQTPSPNRDAILTPKWVRFTRSHFVKESDWNDPLVSPVFADFTGFPPSVIQSSSYELLANDAARLNKAMEKAGVQVKWQEFEGLWHDFQMQAGVLPEADQAIKDMAAELLQMIGLKAA